MNTKSLREQSLSESDFELMAEGHGMRHHRTQNTAMPLDTTEILRAMRPGNSDTGSAAYKTAWAELYNLLRSMSVRCLHGDMATVRDDAVDFVEEKIRAASPLDAILSHDPDAEKDLLTLNRRCEGYLRVMLENRAKSLLRRRARTVYVDPHEPGPLEMRAAEAASDGPDVEAERKYLERLFELARDQRAPRYRSMADVAWKQINELCFDGISMNDILERDEGVSTSGPEIDRSRARDRVLQNHSRLRKELRAELDRLRDTRTWFALDTDLADAALTRLFRRHPSSNTNQKKRTEEP